MDIKENLVINGQNNSAYSREASKQNVANNLRKLLVLYLLLDGTDDPLIAKDYLDAKLDMPTFSQKVLDTKKQLQFQKIITQIREK